MKILKINPKKINKKELGTKTREKLIQIALKDKIIKKMFKEHQDEKIEDDEINSSRVKEELSEADSFKENTHQQLKIESKFQRRNFTGFSFLVKSNAKRDSILTKPKDKKNANSKTMAYEPSSSSDLNIPQKYDIKSKIKEKNSKRRRTSSITSMPDQSVDLESLIINQLKQKYFIEDIVSILFFEYMMLLFLINSVH